MRRGPDPAPTPAPAPLKVYTRAQNCEITARPTALAPRSARARPAAPERYYKFPDEKKTRQPRRVVVQLTTLMRGLLLAAPHGVDNFTAPSSFVLTRCQRCSPHCMSCRETRPRPCGCRRRPDMLRPSAAAFLLRQYQKGEWEGARRRQQQRACHAPLDTKRKMACSGLRAILCETRSDGRRCKRGQRGLRRNGRAGTMRPPQRRVWVCGCVPALCESRTQTGRR